VHAGLLDHRKNLQEKLCEGFLELAMATVALLARQWRKEAADVFL
jgi:hypothetical protein